jgi:hypothetical protein
MTRAVSIALLLFAAALPADAQQDPTKSLTDYRMIVVNDHPSLPITGVFQDDCVYDKRERPGKPLPCLRVPLEQMTWHPVQNGADRLNIAPGVEYQWLIGKYRSDYTMSLRIHWGFGPSAPAQAFTISDVRMLPNVADNLMLRVPIKQ